MLLSLIPQWVSAMPFTTQDQAPLTRILGLPVPRSGVLLEPGVASAEVRFEATNNFVQEQVGTETLILDGETWGTAMRFARGTSWFGRPVEWSVEIPWVVHSRGVLDSTIDSFHDAFGFPDGGRNAVPEDRFTYYYRREGENRVLLTSRQDGFGDLRISIATPIMHARHAGEGTSLNAELVAPTGNEDTLIGGGAWAASSWLAATRRLGDGRYPAKVNANLGVTVGERAGLLGDIRNPLIAFAQAGISYRFWEKLDLGVELRAHTAPYRDTDTRALSSSAISVAFGGAVTIGSRGRFELALVEDLDGLASPDITFHMAFSGQF